jgi:hypothetical protein
VISSSWRLYKAVFKKLLPFSILYAILLGISSALPTHFNKLIAQQQNGATQLNTAAIDLSSWPVLSNLLISLIIFYLMAVVIHQTKQVMYKEPRSYQQSTYIALRKYLIYLVNFIFFAIILAIGYTLLLIPGIYLNILLTFCLVNIVVDNGGIFSAFKHSAQLVWGKWWRTLAVFFVATAIAIFFIAIFATIFSLIFFLIFPHPAKFMINAILSSIAALFTLPWLTSVMLTQYEDLKLRRKIKLEREAAEENG